MERPYTSGDLANKTGMSHSNTLQRINQFITRFPQYREHTKNTYLQHENGVSYNAVLLSKEVFDVCVAQHTIRNARRGLNKGVEEWIFGLFPNEYIIPSMEVGGHTVDFYFKDLHIVVEYDDTEEALVSDKEILRERQVQVELRNEYIAHGGTEANVLNRHPSESFPFVRIIRGKEIQGIRDLLIVMRDQTKQDIVQFME
jgi:hypothetical protein